MLRAVLCCGMLVSFSVRGAEIAATRGQCRAGLCEDRPSCPQSPCRCLYPSKVDCALYYQCVQGEPHQYRCSPGLLFNEDTLTCDYDFNVNCSIAKTTRTTESFTGLMTSITGETTSEFPEKSTKDGNATISDLSSRSLETSTETASHDTSQKRSTEIYRTTVTQKISTKETSKSESSDFSIGTNNATLTGTQSESYSKSTVNDPTTFPNSSVETTEASGLPNYSSSGTALDTTDSKSSDFVTEITSSTPITKQSEGPETTESISTTENDESTETESPVSMSSAPDTPEPTFTDKEGEESETTRSPTTKGKEVSETITPISTVNEIKVTETTMKSEEPEITNPLFTIKDSQEPETTNPSSTIKDSQEPEITNPSSTIKDSQEPETTDSSPTTEEVEKPETTRSGPTIDTTSETASTDGSTRITEYSMSTEETQPEVATSVQNRNWTCPTRFGLFADENDCHKFYHCSHWKPHHKSCPSNLHFNPALGVCDWPENAECGSTVSPEGTEQPSSTPSLQTTTNSGKEASSCGCDSCELPIPDDCNSYILCIDQSATLISCGGGLNFNVRTGTCDWEENVVCETNLQCPLKAGRFPYPQSCHHFMDCNDTVMTVNKCPEGMVYSRSEEKCSWTAVCDGQHIYTSTEKTSSAKNEPTTVTEDSTYIPDSEETAEETSIRNTFTTNRDEMNSFSSSGTTPTKLTDETSRTSWPFRPSTIERDNISSSSSTSFEETTSTGDMTKDQTTRDENDITSTLSQPISTDSAQTSKFRTTSTGESIITEKFTEIPTISSESIPVSSNHDFISTRSTGFSTSSDSFSSDADLPYSSTKFSTISSATDLTTLTEIDANASSSSSTGSFELASSTADDLATDQMNSTEINANASTSSATSSFGLYSSTADDLATDLTTLTEINANASTSSATGSFGLASSTADDPATHVSISTEINTNTSTSSATGSFELASSTADDPATDKMISTEINTNTSTSSATSSFGLSSSTADEMDESSVDTTDASTKNSAITDLSSTEISKLPSTENHSTVRELTESSTNADLKSTEDYSESTSADDSNATTSSTETSVGPSFDCPARFGLFPDPENCSRFYHCSQWVASHEWCPSHLHFSPKLQVCDWPYLAGCDIFFATLRRMRSPKVVKASPNFPFQAVW